MIAALYVQRGGVYWNLDGVDPWDERRDARLYPGPYPVICHSPCARWGRYWSGGPMLARTPRARQLGADDGCFASALAAVRRWGGVLEHPADSKAWPCFGLDMPPRAGGWIRAGSDDPGWTCCVEQGQYGHQARKATWLYAVGVNRPELRWGRSPEDKFRLDQGYHSREERQRAIRTGICQRLSKKQRLTTPIEFRNLLIGMVESARGWWKARVGAPVISLTAGALPP